MNASTPSQGRTTRFRLECSALNLLGYSLLASIAQGLVFFGPWGVQRLYAFVADNTHGSSDSRLSFQGDPRAVFPFMVVISLLTDLDRYDRIPAALVCVANAALGFYVFKWAIEGVQITTASGSMRPKFSGEILQYLGRMILVAVSFVTVVGWAWALSAMLRWCADNTSLPNAARIRFRGDPIEILWRGIAFVVLSLPVISLPWTLRWITGWYVEQVTLEEQGGPGQATRPPAFGGGVTVV